VRLPLDDAGKIAPGRLATALMAMAGLVLLTGVANLAGLTIARGIVRRPEIAVRLTLGASFGRLARQLVIEGILLSAIGGVGGLWDSRWLIALFLASLPSPANSTPVFATLDAPIDLHVLSFTLFVVVIVGVIVGLAPVRQASKTDLLSTLGGVSEAAPRRVRSGLRHWIVIPQVAVCTALLLAAGIAVTTLLSVALVDPGIGQSAPRLSNSNSGGCPRCRQACPTKSESCVSKRRRATNATEAAHSRRCSARAGYRSCRTRGRAAHRGSQQQRRGARRIFSDCGARRCLRRRGDARLLFGDRTTASAGSRV